MAKIKKIKLPPLKAIGKAIVKYREERAAGRIGKISALEDISGFFGKKGQVLKRETRYNTQRTRLIEGAKEVQKQLGKTPGKETFKRITEKRTQATKKAAETFAKKNIKKTKSGAADKRFKKKAKEKADQFLKAVDVFASDTYNDLIDSAYGIGSDTVIAMAEAGLDADEIEEYLKQVKETWEDLPDEAKKLATNDALWQAVKDITDIIQDSGNVDFKEVLGEYIKDTPDPVEFKKALHDYIDYGSSIPFSEFWSATKELNEALEGQNKIDFRDAMETYIKTAPDIEDYKAAIENYIDYKGNSKKPFAAVWEELKDSLDPASYDSLTEIMESEVD